MRSNGMLEQYSSLNFNMSHRNSHFSIKQNRKHDEQESRDSYECVRDLPLKHYDDQKMHLPYPF